MEHNELMKANGKDIIVTGKEKWGEANPRRGVGYVAQAIAFLKSFPIDSTLTTDDFDDWAQKKGYLNVPTGALKKSDAWLAHLQRRHQLKYNINKAASHPRMLDISEGVTPFYIDSPTQGEWVVRAIHFQVLKNELPKRLQGLIGNTFRNFKYLMQGTDYNNLPDYLRTLVDLWGDEVDAFRERTGFELNLLENRATKIQQQLRKGIELGKIKSSDGSLNRFLEYNDKKTSEEIEEPDSEVSTVQ